MFFVTIYCDEPVFGKEEYEAGEIGLGERRHHGLLYYILFRTRDQNPQAPLIWFFEGGPGESSMHGLFYQNGPFRLKKDGTLEQNIYSFNNVANVLYLEQPLGTGFSNCTNTSWVPHHENVIIEDLVTFIYGFLEKHPEFKGRPLYLLSQGYGSHFVLPLAELLLMRVVENANLQGIALGSPWIRPELQLTSQPSFSKNKTLCTEFKYIASMYGYIIASIFIDLDLDVPAFDIIRLGEGVLRGVMNHTFNRYDIRQNCTGGPCNYSFHELTTFLDKPDVRRAMLTTGKTYHHISPEVFRWLILNNEYLSDKSAALIKILDKAEGIPVYLYGGYYDWTVNHVGMDEVIASLHWKGRQQMAAAHWKNWYSDGILQGRYKHVGKLYYAQAIHAGHYVGMDVPSFTFDLMSRLVYGSDH